MPTLGTQARMKKIRIMIPMRLLMKPAAVLPRPFRILWRVLFRYRKGQIQARVMMKSPAISLLKKKRPMVLPKRRKKQVQAMPRGRHRVMVLRMVRAIWFLFPAACDSETEERSMTETALVRTLGNWIKAMAMPVRVP